MMVLWDFLRRFFRICGPSPIWTRPRHTKGLGLGRSLIRRRVCMAKTPHITIRILSCLRPAFWMADFGLVREGNGKWSGHAHDGCAQGTADENHLGGWLGDVVPAGLCAEVDRPCGT